MKSRQNAVLACASILVLAGGLPAPAAAEAGGAVRLAFAAALTKCVIGARVVNRQGKVGVITKDDGGGCTVRQDSGETFYSLFWMLEPTGAGAGGGAGRAAAPARPAGSTPGRLQPGAYQCYGGQAGNLRLNFSAGGRYSNAEGKAGAYTLDGGSGRIAFTSGPWAGFFGRVLPDGKVGLSSQPNTTTYYMVCERK